MTKTTLESKKTKKVLIIEDEGDMCLLLNILLNGEEMELDHVQNLTAAGEYLEKEQPNVIILDNKLPDGKVRRELVKGSIEVYPIPNYGAVQIGLHRFFNNQDPPGTPSPTGKFIHTWKRENGRWRITRVISLHEVGGDSQ